MNANLAPYPSAGNIFCSLDIQTHKELVPSITTVALFFHFIGYLMRLCHIYDQNITNL